MEHEAILDAFMGDAIITDVLGLLKSGKEAVVYRCKAHPATGVDEAAIKIYKDIETRSFKNAKEYLDGRIGRTIKKRRDILHVLSNPRSMQYVWVGAEWEAIRLLHEAGVPVPKPLGLSSGHPALAMELVGGEAVDGCGRGAAPRLRDYRPGLEEASDLRGQLLSALELMLAHDVVHGDFSAYNVLVQDSRAVVIDFPQWADARHSGRAKDLFTRDVKNILSYFEGKAAGDEPDPEAVAAELWGRWEDGDLYRMRDAARLAREWGLAELA